MENRELAEASRADGVLRSTRGGEVGIEVGGGGRAVVGSSSTDRFFIEAVLAALLLDDEPTGERVQGTGNFHIYEPPFERTNEKGDLFGAVS
jgi:hypothetical protein